MKKFITVIITITAMLWMTGCSSDIFEMYKKGRYIETGPATPDMGAPNIISATAVSRTQVNVVFSEELDPVSAVVDTNYYIQGNNRLKITGLILSGDKKTVELSIAGEESYRMLNGKSYTLLVQRVADINSNAISNAFSIFTGIGKVVAELENTPSSSTNLQSINITVKSDTISSYQYSLDNGAWSSEISVSIPITASGLSDGLHTLKVIGKDNVLGDWQAVNQATAFSWTIDRTPPVSTLSNLPESVTANTAAAIIVAGNDVVSYKYSLNGGGYGSEISAGAPISLNGLTGSPATQYTISVIGMDSAGNWQDQGSATAYTWTVNTVDVVASLSNLPSALSNQNLINILVSGSSVTNYKYSIDGGAWIGDGDPTGDNPKPVANPISLSLSDGQHTIRVCGMKIVGMIPVWQNTDDATAYTWTIDTTAPTADIDNSSKPATAATNFRTSDQDIHLIVLETSGLVNYKYKIDTGDWSGLRPASMKIELTGIPEGTHTISILGADAAGNIQSISSPTTYTWIVDLTPPVSALSNIPVGLVTYNTTNIDVSGTDVYAYKYKLDSDAWSEEISEAQDIEFSNLSDGSHTMTVIGKDIAGNWQSIEGATRIQWSVDANAPTAVLSNTPNDPTANTSINISVGGSGVVKYKYNLDGAGWSSETDILNAIEIIGLSETAHTILVIGKDLAGNWQSTGIGVTSYTWTISTSAPEATLTNTPSSNTNLNYTNIYVGGTSIVSYKYKIDGGSYSIETPTGLSYPIALSSLSDGSHTIDVIGKKSNGTWQSESFPTTYTWIVDTGKPTAVLQNLPANPTNTQTINVTVAGSGVVTYQYKLDGEPWSAQAAISVPISRTLSEGSHVLYVAGKDAAGNWQDYSSATEYSWSIDTVSLPAPAVWDIGDYSTSPMLEFHWTTPVGTAEVYIQVAKDASFTNIVYGGSGGISVGNNDFYNYIVDVSNGPSYYARVKIKDAAGNMSGWGSASNGINIVGKITGVVKNSSSLNISGAVVVLKKMSDGSTVPTVPSTITTDLNGVYTISNAAIGSNYYAVTVSAENYNNASKNNITVEAGSISDAGTLFLVSTSAANGTISGTVVDANTANPIAGATIMVKKWDNTDALPSPLYVTSAADGYFTTLPLVPDGLLPGTYSVIISHSGYFNLVVDNVTIAGANLMGRQALCEILTEPQVRVIVLWDGGPSSAYRDLDLHLVGPSNQNVTLDGTPYNRFHVWYTRKAFNENTNTYSSVRDETGTASTASLVQDVISEGYGPESINLYRYGGNQYVYGTFTYTLHQYSGSGGDWSGKKIVMRAYDSLGMVREINFPSTPTTLRYWKAMKISILGVGRSKRTVYVTQDNPDTGADERFGTLNYNTKSSMDW